MKRMTLKGRGSKGGSKDSNADGSEGGCEDANEGGSEGGSKVASEDRRPD